jgi:hypothetical protein
MYDIYLYVYINIYMYYIYIQAVTSKMQFTCSLRDINVSGRADFKAIKTVISKLAPTRVVVLRGKEVDCQATAAYSKANDIQSFTPGNRYGYIYIYVYIYMYIFMYISPSKYT